MSLTLECSDHDYRTAVRTGQERSSVADDALRLTAILTYHVVPGKVMAGDIVKMGGGKPATVNGKPVNVTIKGGKVYVDAAQVTTADVQASNGVIHIIDTVILPGA